MSHRRVSVTDRLLACLLASLVTGDIDCLLLSICAGDDMRTFYDSFRVQFKNTNGNVTSVGRGAEDM